MIYKHSWKSPGEPHRTVVHLLVYLNEKRQEKCKSLFLNQINLVLSKPSNKAAPNYKASVSTVLSWGMGGGGGRWLVLHLCPLTVWSDLLDLCFYFVQLRFQVWVCGVWKTNAQRLRFIISAHLPLGHSNFWRLQRLGLISWRFIKLCVH